MAERRLVRRAGPLIAVWVALSVAAGCDNGGNRLTPMQHYTLEGIPVPRGFTLVDNQSVGVASGETRVAKMQFRGSGDRGEITRFYRELMAEGGWTLKKQDFDRGIYDLRFTNREEECTVRLHSDWNGVYVTIQVLPLPAGATRAGPPRDGARSSGGARRLPTQPNGEPSYPVVPAGQDADGSRGDSGSRPR